MGIIWLLVSLLKNSVTFDETCVIHYIWHSGRIWRIDIEMLEHLILEGFGHTASWMFLCWTSARLIPRINAVYGTGNRYIYIMESSLQTHTLELDHILKIIKVSINIYLLGYISDLLSGLSKQPPNSPNSHHYTMIHPPTQTVPGRQALGHRHGKKMDVKAVSELGWKMLELWWDAAGMRGLDCFLSVDWNG